MMAIEVSGLTKRYAATTALEDVSFGLAAGAAFGLLGPNGSGKSALLRVLAALDRPTAGKVVVMGRDVTDDPQAVRRSIGFVPHTAGVQYGLTVEEQLDFFASCHSLSRRERLAAVEAMLQLVELVPWRDREASDLSRGLRQRLALATALVHNPEVLLLDEPFGGIDAVGRGEMIEVLKELRAMGKTIVVSGYRLEDVAPLCDGFGLLHKGRLVASGPLDEVLVPPPTSGRRVRLEIAAGADRARGLLDEVPQASELVEDNGGLSFLLAGDRLALPALLERLISAGVLITQFTTEGSSAEQALVRTFQELEG